MPQNRTDPRTEQKLGARQTRALAELLGGSTVTSAAKAAGVDRSTVHRWLREDFTFQASLNAARRDMQREVGHRLLAAIIGILVLVTAYAAWTRRAERPELGLIGVAIGTLFVAQIVLGAATVWGGFPVWLKALHLSMASLVWMALAYLTALLVVGSSLPTWMALRRRASAAGLEVATP